MRAIASSVLRAMLTSSAESNEPAFLRKLRGEHGGDGSGRHERPLARPRKQTTDGDEDDQPTYVMENSQDTMSKEEYEALMGKEECGDDGEEGKGKERSQTTKEDENEEEKVVPKGSEPVVEQVAGIGGAKNRRAKREESQG